MTRSISALSLACAILITPCFAKSNLTVKVVDRQSKPVQSSVSFLIGGSWIEIGQTNKKGVLVHPRQCGEAVSIRAQPLDRSYFSPSPRLCAAQVIFKVRKRSDPIVAYFDEYDADKNGRLDRREFVDLAAATSLVARPGPDRQFAYALRTVDGKATNVQATYSLTYEAVAPLASNPDLNAEANAAINDAKAKGLLGVLAVDQPTVRPTEEYAAILRRFLDQAAVAPTGGTNSVAVRALNVTANEFAKLDKNNDGWLSRREVRAAK